MTLKVFITGASSGIGAALARHYAGAGATLALTARRSAVLEEVKRELAGSGASASSAQIEIYSADVTDGASMARAAHAFMEIHGAPDVVIACAGVSIGVDSELAEDLAVFKQVMDTNVFGTLATFQPFISAMKKQGRGALVGIASVAGIRGLPGSAAYSASKSAVITYCESLRVELRGSGVDVVTIAPGYIRTPMTAGNPYPMPFLTDAPVFAARAAAAIAAGVSYQVIPWQMGVVAKLMRMLPNWLYDRLAVKAGRKPRKH
jgi:short-subunit dehydrogenase